jgi:hypothetical protein
VSDREPTPAEERVRRLLADARHREPVPQDVADRLDAVLDGLVAERAPHGAEDHHGAGDHADAGSAGDQLAARRRRRVAVGLLAAAAATVVGLSVPGVLEAARDLATSTGTSQAGQADSAAEPEDVTSGTEAEAEADGPGAPVPQEVRVPVLRDASFTRDVEQAVSDAQDARALRGGSWCPTRAAWGEGRPVPVRYEGERAVLVLRAPADGGRRADVYLCGRDDPARSTTIGPG